MVTSRSALTSSAHLEEIYGADAENDSTSTATGKHNIVPHFSYLIHHLIISVIFELLLNLVALLHCYKLIDYSRI